MNLPTIADKPWLPADCARVVSEIEQVLARANDLSAIDARIAALVSDHEQLLDRESLGLNAGTNIMNPKAAAYLARSLGNRPSLGYPGDKYEMGMEHAAEIEVITENLVKRLFKAPYAEIRVGSGALANLYAFMATCRPGDTIMAFTGEMGGHVTHHEAGAAGLYGLKTVPVPFDGAAMTIDLEALRREAKKLRPKLITVAGSLCLYPYPVREVRAIADEVGAHVLYDAAHMAGIIAGGRFQQPLAEGAQLMTMSTYKAFGGPPSGLVLTTEKEIAERLDRIAYPGLTANFDLGKTAALAISVLDLLEHGEAYADQAIRNARRLGAALAGVGVAVHGVGQRPRTDSHHLALPAQAHGGGQNASKRLARANIMMCGIGLPLAPVEGDLNGIRIGTQEVTRLGMGEEAMAEIARLMARVLVAGEAPERVRADVIDFRKAYQRLAFIR